MIHVSGRVGGSMKCFYVLEDHRVALVGIEEAVDEVAAGAEVQLRDAVDRSAAGRKCVPHYFLRVVPEADVVPHRRAGVWFSVQLGVVNCSWVRPSARGHERDHLQSRACIRHRARCGPTPSAGVRRPATPPSGVRARAARSRSGTSSRSSARARPRASSASQFGTRPSAPAGRSPPFPPTSWPRASSTVGRPRPWRARPSNRAR